ncbi:MAG: TolC family protein [Pyrinomonadaceae bacterium]
MGNRKMKKLLTMFLIAFAAFYPAASGLAQIAIEPVAEKVAPEQIMPEVNRTTGRYLDPVGGLTDDEAVRRALGENGEIKALRDELEASRAMIKQAELRPNPRVGISGSQESFVGNRYSGAISASLPLELGGRRSARIAVAEKQFEVRRAMLENKERELAAEVRNKFGQSLARIEKLRFLEELLANAEQGYKLVAARVTEGKNAPLEQNMSLVELNRLRSMREIAVGEVQIKLLELRNLLGMEAEIPLRLKGDFRDLPMPDAPLTAEIERALAQRPDLRAVALTVDLAEANLEGARADGRLDASVSAGFQRMTRIAPRISGTDPLELSPQLIGENFITFGVDLTLPVRNKNQGSVEAATLSVEAARKRLEFGRLSVRREVTAAFARYQSAVRALTIYQVGVRDQARENLQVVWQTYEFGAKDLLDYIAEERRYLDLENSLIDAQLETYLARTEILQVTGSPKLTVQ